MNYIVLASTIVLILVLFFAFRKFFQKHEKTILKSVSLILALVFFIRYFAVDSSLLDGVLNLSQNNPFSSPFLCFLVSLGVWLGMASVVILIIYPFFKYDVLKNYAKTFCLIVNIFNIALLPQIIFSYTGSYDWSLCGVFMEIEFAISLLYSLYLFCTNGYFKVPKKQVLEMLVALPIILIFSMPPSIPSDYFGIIGSYDSKGFALYHRLYLYLAFIVLIGLYLLLKRKDKEYSRMVLLFISLTTLISYCYDYDFSRFITPTSWPLHLCNTAMFIIPLCLIFRMKRLFYFTLFINVLGAFLAMLMPNYSDVNGAINTSVVRFWINHIMAFVMPVLIILLRVYDRPKLRQFIWSMVGFLVYFVFVLFINAWFSSLGTQVDFFFINSDFVASKLGKWAEDLRNIIVAWNVGGATLIFYPVYQMLFFLVYVVLGLCMWFVYAWIFQIQDFYQTVEAKNKKIKLDESALCVKYGKKTIGECMNESSKNKLVVKNVYKSYGNNKYYSVQDVSLEVLAGEIFGFLGPNGAGKSTIIKCIVGIQPVSKGSIEINGYDIERQPVQAKAQFGFVPDHYALYEKLTGREYINYIADLYGVSKAERDERLNKYVKMLEMENAFDNQIRTYSHGMKQKIAIMSALVHNPKLWILDEPLTGLDPTSIYQVKECMKEHARNGNIVFFSSHIIDIVEKLCDRIMIIKKGKIRTSVRLDELKEKNINLEEFYLNIINQKEDIKDEEVEKENLVVENVPSDSKFYKDKPSLFARIKAKHEAKKQLKAQPNVIEQTKEIEPKAQETKVQENQGEIKQTSVENDEKKAEEKPKTPKKSMSKPSAIKATQEKITKNQKKSTKNTKK